MNSLIQALKHEDVQEEAAKEIKEIKDLQAAEYLIYLLNNRKEDDTIRWVVAEVLVIIVDARLRIIFNKRLILYKTSWVAFYLAEIGCGYYDTPQR